MLDLCAGPGVKATQIAARMQNTGEVVSVELDERRAAQVEELSAQLGAAIVQVVTADARDAHGGGYDRVLVDPSCSDLGTLASGLLVQVGWVAVAGSLAWSRFTSADVTA